MLGYQHAYTQVQDIYMYLYIYKASELPFRLSLNLVLPSFLVSSSWQQQSCQLQETSCCSSNKNQTNNRSEQFHYEFRPQSSLKWKINYRKTDRQTNMRMCKTFVKYECIFYSERKYENNPFIIVRKRLNIISIVCSIYFLHSVHYISVHEKLSFFQI